MEVNLRDLLDILLKKSEIIEEEIMESSGFSELTSRQLECLELIKKFHNPSLTELSLKMGITKPSITTMIDKLDNRGYVKRVRSDSDRRSAHIHLTEKGIEAASLHDHVHEKISRLLQENLSEDEKIRFLNLLNKSLKNF